ncbi:MAG TPA: AMP-binding protein [Streptosporangiaceae bacterium]
MALTEEGRGEMNVAVDAGKTRGEHTTGPPDTEWVAGDACLAPPGGLHEALARVARLWPDAPAIRSAEGCLTYRELDRTADAWAASLIRHGVRPGHQVPVLLPRGKELIIALVAVLKTGAAYALLDPFWPERRVVQATARLDSPVLVAGPGTRSSARLWTPPAGPAEPPAGFRPARVRNTDPCAVFFTSGTTGKPKGVLTTHRATARLFQGNGFARFGPGSSMPLAAPVPWDVFSLELWSVLLNGGTSVITAERYLTAAALRAGIAGSGVNTVWLTSSLFNMIVDEDLTAFTGLDQVMTGGERLSPAHVLRFLRAHPCIALLNGYGPVESVVFASTHRITEADCARPDGIPLGRPVPGTGIHVLDGDQPCAVGRTGEICLSGTGLAVGYLGERALTDAAFVHAEINGEAVRLYRTGDLGYWNEAGLLCFRGRADRQVKIRGHRIEPAEVEQQILTLLPGVRQCRVLVRRDQSGTAVDMVAVCVPETDGDALAGAGPVLAEGLPLFQRPAAVLSVPALPVTAQGKVDERTLITLAADHHRQLEAVASAGVAGPVASLVTQTFAQVLGRDMVPADVSFFALGGTSLDAGRVCARLAAELSRPVWLSWLYQRPDATGLAALLTAPDGCAAGRTGDEPEPIGPEPIGPEPAGPETAGPETAGPVPLTAMQLVYLTRHLLYPQDRTSHCLLAFRIDGPVDTVALQGAIDEVHVRHEPLSACYAADPRPAAWLDEAAPPVLEELPPQRGTRSALRALRAALARPLDPGKGEVWRTVLIPRTDGTSALFGCVVHHIAFDGWSESVLTRDLALAYNGALAPPRPPGLARTRRLYARRQRPATPELIAELADVPDLRWPADPAVQPMGRPAAAPRRIVTKLDPRTVAGIDAAAAAAGTTRFVALLTEWGPAIAEVTGQDDFAVGVPVAQRDGASLADVVGCHIAMVPLRLRGSALTGDRHAVARIAGRAFAAQDVPLPVLLQALSRPRTGRPPLFQVLFAVQDNTPPRLELAGLRSTFLRQPYVDLPLELHTELWPEPDGGLRIEISFRPGWVTPATARQIARHFAARLRAPSGSQR